MMETLEAIKWIYETWRQVYRRICKDFIMDWKTVIPDKINFNIVFLYNVLIE